MELRSASLMSIQSLDIWSTFQTRGQKFDIRVTGKNTDAFQEQSEKCVGGRMPLFQTLHKSAYMDYGLHLRS